MPLKLNVGLSKKVGLPNYGSLGASCHVELELDSGLMNRDHEEFQGHVEDAFTACRDAVERELIGHQSDVDRRTEPCSQTNGTSNANGERGNHACGNGHPRNGSARSHGRPATVNQVRAIHAIADRHGIRLTDLLLDQYGVDDPESLTIAEASRLIDELNETASSAEGDA